MLPALNTCMDTKLFLQKIKHLVHIHPVNQTVTCVPAVKDCDICEKSVMDPRLTCFGTVKNNKLMLTHKCITCNRILYTGKSKTKSGTWDPDYAKTRHMAPVSNPDTNDSAK